MRRPTAGPMSRPTISNLAEYNLCVNGARNLPKYDEVKFPGLAGEVISRRIGGSVRSLAATHSNVRRQRRSGCWGPSWMFMRRRRTGIERVERRVSHTGCRAAKVDHRCVVDLVGGFWATRPGGSRCRCGGSRLDPCRRNGWSLRAEHHDRAGGCRSGATLHAEAAQCAPDDCRAGAVSHRLRQGRRRSSSTPGRGVRDNPCSTSPTELIEYVLHLCDVILVMTVNPGFGGQKFLPEILPKIRRLRRFCDDFSRCIIAWKLCSTMKAEDVTATLNLALKASGLDHAKVIHRPRLLSDNGSSYISADLAKWLDGQDMEHVRGAPYHTMTQSQIERWHQTLTNRILLENYYLPGDLEAQIEAFVADYNHLRYHESC